MRRKEGNFGRRPPPDKVDEAIEKSLGVEVPNIFKITFESDWRNASVTSEETETSTRSTYGIEWSRWRDSVRGEGF